MDADEEIRDLERRLRVDYENANTPEFTYAWLAQEIHKILTEDRERRGGGN